MNRLDAMLQPGEAILWRRDRRVRAGPVWAYLVAALPVAVLGVMFTAILWHVEVPAAIMVLAGLALLFPASMAFLAWADEWLPRAVAVTDNRVLRAGSRESSREELARAEILRADLFEGSGAVDLHLADGGIRAVNGIDDAQGFVRALDVPARVWRRRPQPAAPRSARLAYYAIFVVGFAGPYLSNIALESVTGGPTFRGIRDDSLRARRSHYWHGRHSRPFPRLAPPRDAAAARGGGAAISLLASRPALPWSSRASRGRRPAMDARRQMVRRADRPPGPWRRAGLRLRAGDLRAGRRGRKRRGLSPSSGGSILNQDGDRYTKPTRVYRNATPQLPRCRKC